MQRLDPKQSAIIVVDIQDKLAAAMPASQMSEVLRAATVLLEAASLLGARVLVTEQYPAGLGPTVAPLAERIERLGARVISKLAFSACDEPEFEGAWARLGVGSAIVLGLEAHVCVFQTVRELCARGVQVHVPLDGVASRRDDHRAAGLELCRAAGATITTMESVVFDWLRQAGSDEFKKLSKLIR